MAGDLLAWNPIQRLQRVHQGTGAPILRLWGPGAGLSGLQKVCGPGWCLRGLCRSPDLFAFPACCHLPGSFPFFPNQDLLQVFQPWVSISPETKGALDNIWVDLSGCLHGAPGMAPAPAHISREQPWPIPGHFPFLRPHLGETEVL